MGDTILGYACPAAIGAGLACAARDPGAPSSIVFFGCFAFVVLGYAMAVWREE